LRFLENAIVVYLTGHFLFTIFQYAFLLQKSLRLTLLILHLNDSLINSASILVHRVFFIVINCDIYHFATNWFVLWIVELCAEWVLQHIFNPAPLVWIKYQKFREQLQRIRLYRCEEILHWPLLDFRYRVQHLLSLLTFDLFDILL